MALAARQQGILNLHIKDKDTLYKAFMPFIENGGLFIPTTRDYKLGDDVFMLLSLMDDPDRVPAAGKIVWITPGGAEGNRSPGIGVQFSDQDGGVTRNKIEMLLADVLKSGAPTHTM